MKYLLILFMAMFLSCEIAVEKPAEDVIEEPKDDVPKGDNSLTAWSDIFIDDVDHTYIMEASEFNPHYPLVLQSGTTYGAERSVIDNQPLYYQWGSMFFETPIGDYIEFEMADNIPLELAQWFRWDSEDIRQVYNISINQLSTETFTLQKGDEVVKVNVYKDANRTILLKVYTVIF